METIVCDPAVFAPTRTPLGLDELGIRVVDADWGDADHELFLIRQERGEIPADRHPPDRTITIKLQAKSEGATPLAKAAQKLQMKVGRWQDEGGWIERQLKEADGFISGVGFIVHSATLTGIQGWLMAHRKAANEITLTITASPYCYGTKEVESGEVKVAEGRQLEWEIPNVLGTAPGIFRAKVKNEGAKDWMGILSAMESRDHSSAATAKMSYEAEELTLLGESAKAARAESSGEVVKTGVLPANRTLAVLGSKISASGLHMTHVGPRKILVRVWNPNADASKIKMRLQWRVLGSIEWITNDAVVCPLSENFAWVDLGEVRPETAVLGSQKWEFQITLLTEGEGERLELDKILIPPTEQYQILQQYFIEEVPSSYTAIDNFVGAAGALTGQAATLGGNWEGAGDVDDFSKSGKAIRTAGSDVEGTPRYEFLPPKAKGVKVKSFWRNLANPKETTQVRSGILARYIDTNNWIALVTVRNSTTSIDGNVYYYLRLYKKVEGVKKTIAEWIGDPGPVFQGPVGTAIGGFIELTVLENGEWRVGADGTTLKSGVDADFSGAGKLAEGKTGLFDECTSAVFQTREWEKFEAYPLTELKNAACFSGRSIEIRSDGTYRQHSTEDVWARMAPDGFLPYAPPSGLEARAVRGLIVPSQGNFEAIPDEGKVSLSAKIFYFPGYHFTSEAV